MPKPSWWPGATAALASRPTSDPRAAARSPRSSGDRLARVMASSRLANGRCARSAIHFVAIAGELPGSAVSASGSAWLRSTLGASIEPAENLICSPSSACATALTCSPA